MCGDVIWVSACGYRGGHQRASRWLVLRHRDSLSGILLHRSINTHLLLLIRLSFPASRISVGLFSSSLVELRPSACLCSPHKRQHTNGLLFHLGIWFYTSIHSLYVFYDLNILSLDLVIRYLCIYLIYYLISNNIW